MCTAPCFWGVRHWSHAQLFVGDDGWDTGFEYGFIGSSKDEPKILWWALVMREREREGTLSRGVVVVVMMTMIMLMFLGYIIFEDSLLSYATKFFCLPVRIIVICIIPFFFMDFLPPQLSGPCVLSRSHPHFEFRYL